MKDDLEDKVAFLANAWMDDSVDYAVYEAALQAVLEAGKEILKRRKEKS